MSPHLTESKAVLVLKSEVSDFVDSSVLDADDSDDDERDADDGSQGQHRSRNHDHQQVNAGHGRPSVPVAFMGHGRNCGWDC